MILLLPRDAVAFAREPRSLARRGSFGFYRRSTNVLAVLETPQRSTPTQSIRVAWICRASIAACSSASVVFTRSGKK